MRSPSCIVVHNLRVRWGLVGMALIIGTVPAIASPAAIAATVSAGANSPTSAAAASHGRMTQAAWSSAIQTVSPESQAWCTTFGGDGSGGVFYGWTGLSPNLLFVDLQ